MHVTPRSFTQGLQASLALEPQHRQWLAVAFRVPLENVIKTEEAVDRHGADYVILRPPAPPVLVDWKDRFNGADRRARRDDPEIAVEYTSVGKVPGPAFRRNISCDFQVHMFHDLPDRIYVIGAVELHEATRRGVFDHHKLHSTWTQGDSRPDYESTCRYVPVSEVKEATGAVWMVPLTNSGNATVPVPNLGNFPMPSA